MLVYTAAVVRLKCSFHFLLFILINILVQRGQYGPFWAAKLRIISEITKKTAEISLIIYVFFVFCFALS